MSQRSVEHSAVDSYVRHASLVLSVEAGSSEFTPTLLLKEAAHKSPSAGLVANVFLLVIIPPITNDGELPEA